MALAATIVMLVHPVVSLDVQDAGEDEIPAVVVAHEDIDAPPAIFPDTVSLDSCGKVFTENLGQWGDPWVTHFAQGDPLSIFLGPGGALYHLRDGGGVGTSFRTTFLHSNGVEPIGSGVLRHSSSYFLGSDPEGWVTGARSFDEVRYQGLYEGIDLRYYFLDGRLKYDLEMRPGVDPDVVHMRYEGVDSLSVDPATGDLLIGTSAGTLRDMAPVAYQPSAGSDHGVSCSFVLAGGSTVTFSCPDVNPVLPLVIDPGLRFSTYFGTAATLDRVYGMDGVALDDGNNIYITGDTWGFQAPGLEHIYHGNTSDLDMNSFVAKLSPDASRVEFSIIFGGSHAEVSHAIALDPSGRIWLGGATGSPDFPLTEDAMCSEIDAWQSFIGFLIQFAEDGNGLLYSTFVKGHGDVEDIDLDEEGSMFILGYGTQGDFQVTEGAFCTTHNGMWDIILMKLDLSSKEFEWGTYVGGSDIDVAESFTVAPDGRVYVAGSTKSMDFPVTPGAPQSLYQGSSGHYRRGDGVVFCLDGDGSDLLFSTYFGGPEDDWCRGCMLDEDSSVWFWGYTESQQLPTTGDAFQRYFGGSKEDGFYAKLADNGTSLEYCTYIGGSENDWCTRALLRPDGKHVIVGMTVSADFPVPLTAYDATIPSRSCTGFVALFDPTRGRLVNSTYVGGKDADLNSGNGAVLRSDGTIVVHGDTDSADFPTTPGCLKSTGDSSERDNVVFGLTFGPVPTDALPGAPRNLVATPGDEIVDLAWDAPETSGSWSIGRYRIYVGLAPGSEVLHDEVPRTTSYRCAGLTNGVEFFFRVSAVTMVGEGPLSDRASATPIDLPEAPRNLTVTPGNASLLVEWDPPVDWEDHEILGYHLFRRTIEDGITHITVVRNGTAHLDEGLEAGGVYRYAVLAYTAMGLGKSSYEVSGVPLGPPTAPRELEAVPGDGLVELAWRAPVNDPYRPVLGYRVLRGTSPDGLVLLGHVGLERTATDTNLTNGQTYHYAVVAYNRFGNSTISNIVSVVPFGRPGPVVNFTLTAFNESVLLTWGPPLDDGGNPKITYEVRRGLGRTGRTVRFTGLVNTSFVDDQLRFGQTYYYWVYASNEAGLGPPVGHRSVLLLEVPGPPKNLEVEEGDGQNTLRWYEPYFTPGTRNVDGYHLLRGNWSDDLVLLADLGRDARGYQDDEVVNGCTYYYAIRAYNSLHVGPMSDVVPGCPYGLPTHPVNLSIEAIGTSATLTWQVPAFDGGRPIEGYLVYTGTRADSLFMLGRVDGTTTYVFEGIIKGMTHYFQVAAVNARGTGPRGKVAEVTWLTEPTACSFIYADLTEEAHVGLSWGMPGDDGGTTITGYILLRGLSEDDLQMLSMTESERIFMDTGVERGKTYYYSVIAFNKEGSGPACGPVVITIPEAEEDPDDVVEYEPPWMWLILVLLIFLATIVSVLFLLRWYSDRIGEDVGPLRPPT